MSNITYRRGQADWALWQLFRLGSGGAPESVPRGFCARIKKLLDLDRGQAGLNLPVPGHAFGKHKQERTSRDAQFTSFDVFCLGVALDLLDAGFLQTDAVAFIRGARVKLQKEFHLIITHYPPVTRARRLAKDHPRLPSFVENGTRIADTRVYLATRKRELTEVRSMPGKVRGPYMTEPEFAHGRDELQNHLMSLSPYARSALVLEFGSTAKLIEAFLDRAPTINRARKN